MEHAPRRFGWLALWLLVAAWLPVAVMAQESRVGSEELPSDQTAYSPLTKEAEQLWQQGKYKSARKKFELVEQRSLSSRERAHAILAQGDCQLREGHEYKAYQKYKKAIDNYSSFIPLQRVLQSEYNIAEKYFAGNFGRFLFWHYSTRDKAVEIYDAITKAAPYGPLAPKALSEAARLSWDDKEYQKSIDKYNELVTKYPDYEKAAEVRLAYIRALLGYASISDGDGLLIARANLELDKYIKLFPNSAGIEEARTLRAEAREVEAKRLVYLGEFYQRPAHPRYPAASRYLGRVLKDYKDTKVAGEAQQLKEVVDSKVAALHQPVPGAEGSATASDDTEDGAAGVPGPNGTGKPNTDQPASPILEGTRNSEKWLLPIIDLHPAPAKESKAP